MSSSMEEDEPAEEEEEEEEEEVQFVSEGPLRPVLDFIDIPSGSDEDGGMTDEAGGMTELIEDKIARQKAQVNSTLDQLKLRVAAEKQERADRCKALKEKQMSQRAHGRQGLAVAATTDYDAKRCVEMWLKMPGVRPGVLNGGRGRRQQTSFPSGSTSRHICPVMNCGKVFENIPLMDGHLKRFDHSPCDPTVHLRGSPSELFACVACTRHFDTEEAWKKHLQAKVSSSDPGGHDISQACQMIVCFACPACYLLFNLRDQCLQHMSAKNHFTQALTMIKDPKGRALPVPIPSSAKSHLIDLCKDVDFHVRCNECRKALTSHQEAQAHFNVYCRQGRAVSEAEKTVVQVMQKLQPRGQCLLCCEVFLSHGDLERHREATQHAVEVNQTVEKALLEFCHFREIQCARRSKEVARKDRRLARRGGPQRRDDDGCGSAPAKRRKLGPGESEDANTMVLGWVCECGLHFPEEAVANKHLMAANQLVHQCGVCGKHMGDLSITRLHMCRFHGGAHLSNFLYHCRPCKVDMPRYEDILSHVVDAHSGHTYCLEQEVPQERVADAKPSTSGTCGRSKAPADRRASRAPAPAPEPAPNPKWMCRMCEETFGSKADVRRHCGDVTSHSFQRFVCGHCPQKFFKESTVGRHCVSEHDGHVAMAYFCGLCDSMQFERKEEFTEHYEKLHSKDYYCLDNPEGSTKPVPPDVVRPTELDDHDVPSRGSPAAESRCPCMGSEKCEGERKALYTQCMRKLSAEGQCDYVCAPCSVTVSSFAQIKTHVHSTHASLALANTFDVVCKACLESFPSVPTFHKHFHAEHCLLAPCHGRQRSPVSTAVGILDAVEINPRLDGAEDVKLAEVLGSMDDGGNRVDDAQESESDEEMKRALALSVTEATQPPGELDEDMEKALAVSAVQTRESPDLEEALKRSLLEF